ncbi:translocation/assembly module TamB domain-containing protein [Aliiroseovarius sp. 2305UL8-7]|uniref:translocation/assembly module TamB domain-containing protein n=1 Tax=Aliiroseovarius conchicola TaxID=3121637 RepID=UPI00352996BA
MKKIFHIAALLATFICATSAFAQTETDDRGYLQAFLEDNLSDVGRDIRIVGFNGAFSSSATVDQITVADDEGIWLTMNGIVLEWTRSSLLRGAINISELSAKEIIIARQPIPVGGVPAPEAAGFSLPELPVSVEIGLIKAARVELGAPVIGEAAVIQLEGTAKLSGGDGSAKLDVQRIDGTKGTLLLDGAYSNASRQLDLNLEVDESDGGIAAKVLDLPGHPAIVLKVAGSGPLSDFIADINLSTDGQERLAGQVELREEPVQAVSTDGTPAVTQRFSANLSGDIAPVLLPEYRDFFGDNVSLMAEGQRSPDGALGLDVLQVYTEALQLNGRLALSEDGWPDSFSLVGRIAAATGEPVLLPISGAKTRVKAADLNIRYDAAKGDVWRADFILTALTRDDLELERATITATGDLIRGEGTQVGRVDGDVSLKLQGIAPKSGDLAQAVGPAVSGKLAFEWREDAPLQIAKLDLSGTDYTLTGGLTADDLESGITVNTTDDMVLRANDLSQFAALIGIPLTGAVQVGVDGTMSLLGGSFDLAINGTGRDLSIGQKQFDPLIVGDSTLDIVAVRDEAGTRLEKVVIATEQATASLSANLKTDASTAAFDISVNDSSVVDPGLSGASTLIGTVKQTGENWAVLADVTAPGGVEANIDGSVQIGDSGPGLLKGDLRVKAASIAPYGRLAGRTLSGALNAEGTGQYDIATGTFETQLNATSTNLRLGTPSLDALTRGQGSYTVRAHRDDTKVVFLDALSATTPELNLQATGRSDNGRNALDFNAKLRDLATVADGISGPATASGTATLQGDTWQIAVKADGPGGTNANVNGTVQSDASRANLSINGSAPLELANRLIQPRLLTGQANFDLTLNGPLSLAGLSGTVQTSGARLALPTFRQALDLNTATATLSGGQANLNILTSVEAGGQISTQGNVSLTAPYQADLQVGINQVTLTDGVLFETLVNGDGTVRGPLTSGATLRANLALGRTEIRIAEVPASPVPIMAELAHINESAAVRQTRSFAGLIVEPQPKSAAARPYPIDITLSAPSQMFVRGRGLDAELGGQLRLSGTSDNVIPLGQFDLVRGRLDILGKRLTLTEGRVSLQGGFDPYLYFVAESQAEEALVRISVTGPASAPDVSFTSVPELPQDEVLARLLFGRDISKISPLQALKLAAAVRTLAGKGGEGIIGKLRNNFALDDLDLTTDENGEATLKAGKYISDNIYTDVAIGADGDTEINLNLNITPSLTARGTLGGDGTSSIGVFFERDY